jgi:hypothetical protein
MLADRIDWPHLLRSTRRKAFGSSPVAAPGVDAQLQERRAGLLLEELEGGERRRGGDRDADRVRPRLRGGDQLGHGAHRVARGGRLLGETSARWPGHHEAHRPRRTGLGMGLAAGGSELGGGGAQGVAADGCVRHCVRSGAQ